MLNFILGVLFVKIIEPIIQCIVSIINVKTQEYSWNVSERVAKVQSNIQKMDVQIQKTNEKNPMGFQTSAIGFEINNEQNQEGEYE